jgi:CDP-4-dehydro-6-deoxyglucose reductase/ferredoxin-NAD(P)+ reductase (naphthalene dioxygenase ferredoxin-specific)
MTSIVTVRQWPHPLRVRPGRTILKAALAVGIPYPHGCRSGNCGACKSRLITGEVEMAPYSDHALSEAERARGLILACQATPLTDCTVSWPERDLPAIHPRRVLACRVSDIAGLTHDIRRIRLTVDSAEKLSFSAGQYVAVTFAGHAAQDYSMANRPDEPELEFHIRSAGGGASAHACESLAPGDPVTVEGPFGASHLRTKHEGPILAIAGGSGLAPIKSIVETALSESPDRPIAVYFGARDTRDLYLTEHFAALVRHYPNLSFTPVLSQPTAPTDHRTGYVGEIAAAELANTDGAKAYLAGPPALVDATVPLLRARGMSPSDIHADAFYTQAENLQRNRSA